jgi:hypothetical protein
MAEVDVRGGRVGLDAVVRMNLDQTRSRIFRLWIDKGNGKYRAIDITRLDVEHVLKMIQGTLGGARSKPPRSMRK